MRRLFVVAALLSMTFTGGVAQAHHGKVHFARYTSTNAPAYMPSNITIRCRTADVSHLVLVGYLEDRAVYRCKGSA